ncbi:MAG: hypothetical protein KAS93_06690 [Gammaproteobacteria bacterium]|nr:hypothetical protein [Gammaproteobacteria bacterium]
MTTDRRLIHDFIERVHAKRYRRDRSYDYEASSMEVNQLKAKRYGVLTDINRSINVNMVDIHSNNLYEIYTCNAEPVTYCGELKPAGHVSGWDIKWILAPNKAAVEQYPFFDCIISRNDNSTGQAIDAELFLP